MMDNQQERVENAINSVAVLGEISVIYYKSALKAGAEPAEAIALAKGFVESWLKTGMVALEQRRQNGQGQAKNK